MIVISIHIPSVFIGFLIGYIVLATLWILISAKDASWGNGWDCGYRSGIEEGRKREKRERENGTQRWKKVIHHDGQNRNHCGLQISRRTGR